MGILTNFLKLLKPEPNDFVDVAKHISENYDKLDLNAKSNNETLTNLSNNKLDKGTYSGNASDLKSEIDEKVSKSGDTMTGTLTISDSDFPEVVFNNIGLAAVGYDVDSKFAYLRATNGTGLTIYGNNTARLRANNLNTKNKEVVAAINEIEEKFKNFCPVPVGWLAYVDTEEHPATRFLGTTWIKLEDVFIRGTSSNSASGQTGGSNTKTIIQANLPNVKLQVDSFSLGRGTQEITGTFAGYTVRGNSNVAGAFTSDNATYQGPKDTDDIIEGQNTTTFTASRSWTGMSTSASPFTSALGSATALDITPAYYTVHIWKRLS